MNGSFHHAKRRILKGAKQVHSYTILGPSKWANMGRERERLEDNCLAVVVMIGPDYCDVVG